MWGLLSTLLNYCYQYYYFVASPMFLVPDWQLPLQPLTSDPFFKSRKEAKISSIIPQRLFSVSGKHFDVFLSVGKWISREMMDG